MAVSQSVNVSGHTGAGAVVRGDMPGQTRAVNVFTNHHKLDRKEEAINDKNAIVLTN